MIAKLTPAEIARALQVYCGAKWNVSADSLTVKLHWRGEYATVETAKAVTHPVEGHHG